MRRNSILVLLVIFIALGGVWYYMRVPKPADKTEKPYAWAVDMDDLKGIEIALPKESGSPGVSFIKLPDETWRFNDAKQSQINPERWGGGIPLLVSGPRADRIIYPNAPQFKLQEFGLTEPTMLVTLLLKNERSIKIAIGDATPNVGNFYVQVPNTSDVATVDYSWYSVVERLVKEPPYLVQPTATAAGP